jgi:hypothetical protein
MAKMRRPQGPRQTTFSASFSPFFPSSRVAIGRLATITAETEPDPILPLARGDNVTARGDIRLAVTSSMSPVTFAVTFPAQ